MATKGTRVKPREIKRMVELYENLGSYSAVAKKVRRDRSTVAKYIQQYEEVEKAKQHTKEVEEAKSKGKEKNITINI